MHDQRIGTFDIKWFITVTTHQFVQLIRRNATQNGRPCNLCIIQMQNRQNGTVENRIDEFVGMPAGRQRPGFGFTVTDHTGHDQIGIVESRAESVRQGISQLATFIDRARRFGGSMAWNTARERKLGKQLFHPFLVFGDVGIKFAVRSFKVGIGNQSRTTMSRTGNENHVQIVFLDHTIHMDINEIQARCRTPVSQQTRLDIVRL